MATTPAKTAQKGKTAPGLRIVARPDSFRRAGREFGREPQEILLDDLTKEQIAALKAEPELVVTEIEIALPAEEETAKE